MPLRTEMNMTVQHDNDDSLENKLLAFPYKTKLKLTELCCCFRSEANMSSAFFSHLPKPFSPTTISREDLV